MRTYEELFIVNPGATEEEIDALVEQLRGVITHDGGTLDKVDKWGIRKLAYRVDKFNEGFYILLSFSAGPNVAKELERRLRVADLVIRFITVRMDLRMKRVIKRQKKREKRAARRPAIVAAPALPASPMPAPPSPGTLPGTPMPAAPAAEENPTES